jgi:autotransporter translocation and assembly factor TamB
MSVDGYVSLEQPSNPSFSLKAVAQNFHIIEKPGLASLDISTDTPLTVRGSYKGATVSGAVRVDRGTVYIPS